MNLGAFDQTNDLELPRRDLSGRGDMILPREQYLSENMDMLRKVLNDDH